MLFEKVKDVALNTYNPISYHPTTCLLTISSFISSFPSSTRLGKFVCRSKLQNEGNECTKENDTWEIVLLPDGKRAVGCKWVFSIKYKSGVIVER